MAYSIVIPRLGLTMEAGRVVQWYKRSGESVTAGEPLFAVESDKAVQDIEALASGVVYPLPNLPDKPLPIATVIGYILGPGEALPPDLGAGQSAPQAPGQGPSSAAAAVLAPPVIAPPSPTRKLSSPAARRRARELGLDWRTVERPGGGPILRAHVEEAAALRAQRLAQPSPRPRQEVYYPATRQTETLVLEADADRLAGLRSQLQAALAARGSAAPSLEQLLARLADAAIKQTPDVRLLADFNLGTVYAGDEGPDTLLLGLEPTQVAVLGVGRIGRRPTDWQGQLALRTRATLALTYDRGLLPRASAQRLLERLRALLEQPYLLLAAG